MKKIIAGLLTALALCVTAQAEMITVGGDQTAGTGTITINYDIVFTITSATSAGLLYFEFDEVVLNDGSVDSVDLLGLEFSVNGGSLTSITKWLDNDAPFGDVTENDGYLRGSSVALFIGDKVTLHAGTGTMQSTSPTFNSWSSGDYDMFLADALGNQISDVVPEPATAGLLGISAIVFYALRRIKNFNRSV